MLTRELRPAGPYSLRLSARFAGDATRRMIDGALITTVAVGEGLETVRAWQRSDGLIVIQAESEAGVEHMRFVLGIDDDHSEFLRRFADDPLLGRTVKHLRGLRPMRTGSVAHALLKAVAGQLITAREARRIDRAVTRHASPALGGLHAAPSSEALGRYSTAELRRLGLGMRRADTLVRLCRSFDLERLKDQPTAAVAARLEREPGLGPWSVGVVCLYGLGRFERGLARDLGLVKLASELWGRRVEAEETDALLTPYEEWAGLASVHLLAGYTSGLVPFRDAHRNSRSRQDRRVAHRRAA